MLAESKRLFGTNGIRGIVNKELTPQMAVQTGTAIGTFFKRGSLVVGHDARTSSSMLAAAAIAGLNSTGCNVLFAGLMPTPAIQFWIRGHKADGGVIITASHNPPEYNGVKVIWNDGVELSREQEVEIEDAYFSSRIDFAEWNALGETQAATGIVDEYVDAVKGHVDVRAIIKRHYHIVVDAANSVGSLTAPRLLNELGCKVTELNTEMNGTFPGRPPEPRPENLKTLASTVRAVHADLGVAYDSDADRAIFVDETGQINTGDKSFALIGKFFLNHNPGEKIVTSISSSNMIKDIAERHRGHVVWTKVGSITVSQIMKQTGSKLGGEEYGGIFYGPHQPVRDGAMATALILSIMAETREKLSSLFNALPKYFTRNARVQCPEQLKQKVLQKLTEQVKEPNINTLDGVKIWFTDKSAILMRPSGTEPVYRLYAEAKTAEKAEQLVNQYSSKVKKLIKSLSG